MLKISVKYWKAGPPSRNTAMLGPIQNELRYRIIQDIFKDSQRNGYRFALKGDASSDDVGFIVQPAIIDNPPEDSKVVREEVFGKYQKISNRE